MHRPRIVTLTPAPTGWWAVRLITPTAGEPWFARDPIAAWALTEDDQAEQTVVAVVANGQGLELWTPDTETDGVWLEGSTLCSCTEPTPDDDGPDWCAGCGATIAATSAAAPAVTA